MEISEMEVIPEKVTIIRYNPKTTDIMELKKSLLDHDLPCAQAIIIPNDVEISQMTPRQAEQVLYDLQEALKEICQNKGNSP